LVQIKGAIIDVEYHLIKLRTLWIMQENGTTIQLRLSAKMNQTLPPNIYGAEVRGEAYEFKPGQYTSEWLTINEPEVDSLLQADRCVCIIDSNEASQNPETVADLRAFNIDIAISPLTGTGADLVPSSRIGIQRKTYDDLCQCMIGETEVAMADGSTKMIKTLVEERSLGQNVWALRFDELSKPCFEPMPISNVFRYDNCQKVIAVVLRGGDKLKVTSKTKFLFGGSDRLDHNCQIRSTWVKASELKRGMWIATPSKLSSSSSHQPFFTIDVFEATKVHVHNREVLNTCVRACYARIARNRSPVFSRIGVLAKIVQIPQERLRYIILDQKARPTFDEIVKLAKFGGFSLDDVKNNISDVSTVSYRWHSRRIHINPKLTHELLYMHGLVSSDGHISRYRVSFCSVSKELIRAFRILLDRILGMKNPRIDRMVADVTFKDGHKVKSNADTISINYLTVAELFRGISNVLPKLSVELTIAWLKGFFDGDGTMPPLPYKGQNGCQLTICTANLEEASLVRHLLLKIGISSNLAGKYVNIYGLHLVQQTLRTIGFRQNERAKRAKITLARTYYGASSKDIRHHILGDVLWRKVVAVQEEQTNETVYDLEVAGHHSFIANNIIVHNSISNGRLFDEMDELASSYEIPILMIEGIEPTHSHMQAPSVEGVLAYLCRTIPDIRIVVRPNRYTCSLFIKSLVFGEQTDKHHLPSLKQWKRADDLNEARLSIAQQLPGIGPRKSRRMLHDKKTIDEVAQLSEIDLRKYTSKSKDAAKVLHEPYEENKR
jgi:ERCC4-type nuclease